MTYIKNLLSQPGYECTLFFERTSHEELTEKVAELPTDTYLARYSKDGNVFTSAFRAFKAVDIFDPLCDAGYTVHEIKFGYGRIKPRLFSAKAKS